MRVAVIDCGTNTVRLYIADATPDGLADVLRRLEFGRLGEGVDATGRFAPEALARVFAILDDYGAVIAGAHVDRTRFVATSAARDVKNRDEFFAGVRARLGIDPDVISGDEEAELSFLGALSGGPLADGSVLVMDVGGGSTELIRGRWMSSARSTIDARISLNMGSVRIRERYFHGDPPAAGEIRQARQFVDGLLDRAGTELAAVDTWIGVAGTSTSLTAMSQGLAAYDRTKVHNSVIDRPTIEALVDRLLSTSVADTIRDYPSLQPERAEVIAAGALIVAEVARRVDRPMLVRETDILDGAALKLVRS